MDILSESKKVYDYAVKVRRHLHENPEPTSFEFNTVKFICAELEKMGIKYVNVRDGGVLGFIEGEKTGKTILLRADCDALSMQEYPENAKGPKAVVSKVDGVAHCCGHDSHTAMLLSAAQILNSHKDEIEGRIITLFERGEEGGSNIYYVMKYIEQNGIHIDCVYATHSETDLPVGALGVSLGASSAGNVNFQVNITGKGGHGSRPDLSNNPIDCFIAIAVAMKDLRLKYTDPFSALTYTLGSVQSGTKRNVIPQTLRFMGTCRFYDAGAGKAFKDHLKKIVDSCCALYDCTCEYETFSGPSLPVVNFRPAADLAFKLIDNACGDESVRENKPALGSESFSVLTSYYPGCMVKVGMGNKEKGITYGGHHPCHDLDEEGMPYGIASYVAYAIGYLKESFDASSFKPFEGNADDMHSFMDRPIPIRRDAE